MIDSKIVFTSDTAVDDESVTNFHIQYHDAPESPKMPPQEAPSMQENPTSSDHSRPTDTTTSPVDTETPRTTETLTPEARVALSFRDFTAKQGYSSDPAIFLAGDGDLGTLYDLFEEYVHLRQNPFMDHEKYQESLKNYCEQRLTPMLTDLFAKEHETFREFIRALALGI